MNRTGRRLLFSAVCLALLLGGYCIGHTLRLHKASVLASDISQIYSIHFENTALGTYKKVQEEEFVVYSETDQNDLNSPSSKEGGMTCEYVPSPEELLKLQRDKQALYDLLSYANLAPTRAGTVPRQWEYRLSVNGMHLNPYIGYRTNTGSYIYIDREGIAVFARYYFYLADTQFSPVKYFDAFMAAR